MKITTIIRCVFFAINVFITWYCIRISTEKTTGVIYISLSIYFLLYAWIVNFLIKREFKPKSYEIEDAFKIEKRILPSEIAFAMGKNFEKQLFIGDVLHVWRQGFLKLNEQGELTYILSKRGYKSLFNVNSDGVIRKQLSMVSFQKKLSKKREINFKSSWRIDVIFSFFIFNMLFYYKGEFGKSLALLVASIIAYSAVSYGIRSVKKKIQKEQSQFLISLLKLPVILIIKYVKYWASLDIPISIKLLISPAWFVGFPILSVLLLCLVLAVTFGMYYFLAAIVVHNTLANYMWETFQFQNDNMIQFLTFFTPGFMIIYVLYLMSTPTKSVTVKGYDLMNNANFMSTYLQQSPKDEKGRLILYPHHIPFAVSLGLKGYRLENLNNREERDLLIEKLFVDRTNSEKIQISSCLSYFINQTQKEK